MASAKTRAASQFYPEIDESTLRLYEFFYPPSGRFSKADALHYPRKGGNWKWFRYLEIPDSVLDDIKRTSKYWFFDDIQIWTPLSMSIEQTGKWCSYREGFVVGVVGQRVVDKEENVPSGIKLRYFEIARWGNDLLSHDEIGHAAAKRLIDSYASYEQEYPSPILEFVKNIITTGEKYYGNRIHKAWWRRHCGQRMYWVNHTQVCPVCGKDVRRGDH
jgi:hypothetical protein